MWQNVRKYFRINFTIQSKIDSLRSAQLKIDTVFAEKYNGMNMNQNNLTYDI